MKRIGTLAAAVLLLSVFLYAQNAQNIRNDSPPLWVLSASAFTVDEITAGFEPVSSGHEEKITELLPKLILEKLSQTGMRTVMPEELFRREKKSIADNKRKLYAQLEKAVAERDTYIVSVHDEKKRRFQIDEKEKAIYALNAELEQNAEKDKVLSVEAFKPVREQVVLWKNTYSELYPSLKKSMRADEPSDIRGLVTGSISRIGPYIQANVNLVLFPGSVVCLHISETEHIEELSLLAARISEKLLVNLRNGKTVNLIFDVLPPEAAQKAVIRLDGRLLSVSRNRFEYSDSAENELRGSGNGLLSAVIPEGIHELYIEADGFGASAFVYNFSEKDNFYVHARLPRQNAIPVKIKTDTQDSYLFYFNGLPAEPLSKTKNTFMVNGFPVLVELTDAGGLRHFILEQKTSKNLYIPEYRIPNESMANAAAIEKKRKIMYDSYAALIISLPAAFILMGKQVDEYNAWALGKNTGDDLQKWKAASYTATGISIGLGINFLVQLGIYLHSVNAVLPKQIKPAKY
ncbi:hypothetical protein H0R92_01425 [Treponema sp. OMZ 840]|uniref:hypothetical protein n=1 Tax=Treponema sp. OMZ 840 TaxID=244313 RepID=UPI003D89B917